MAEFSQKRGKRRSDEGLGSMVDFLLANARLVLGVGGAAVLGIATLAVKRFIDRATSPRDEDDTKADSWKELSLLKATPHLQPRPPPAALSQPVLPLAPSSSAPGEAAGLRAGPCDHPSSPGGFGQTAGWRHRPGAAGLLSEQVPGTALWGIRAWGAALRRAAGGGCGPCASPGATGAGAGPVEPGAGRGHCGEGPSLLGRAQDAA
ncbi:mitochondrial elongation factor 2 [Homo sapiens]|uniref:Isoform 2 of Mitochondrial dynamics protein MID49 n=1 Tax=Homo sapiens TaxID=9606 RepID=Q96C03-2|nr:mitochondrial dynamics protein MID49 isoform 3 [Homo sapiens]EAW55652.1 Smith-Magenis syndrome chromosome region, candidate 7, isoform CRA_b [Homo sapiens]KAI2581719.1 mitochondrial elongation factor 2 [Homo sapiens]KAI4048229.1 mitochondrial elongation factor 2 [Homo sapiens]BAC87377.1 unnamed protein product [Homo sapiens]|eukprot:NP_001138372.1 mitochondrial dynamics protein MID49 isoform 3 [Homo sapiens]